MRLFDLLADVPTIHNYSEASGRCPRLDDEMLAFLDGHLQPGMRTVETGAGVSTILFAMRQARHTCIVPDQRQVERIAAYCGTHGISLAQVTFVVEPSQAALPRLGEYGFDVALIDGGHGFPMPFLDWFYLAGLLKVGGVCVIDDLHIWTCEALVAFLAQEPEWEVLRETARAAVVRKRAEGRHPKEWTEQRFVRGRSRATSLGAKLAYAWRLARRRQFDLLLANGRARLRRR
ncbi:MAG TPA: class I SAM-dependent methyltransferase [Roseiflexaceae bacterium]|nr:class I SAM-dependent methyltransferase [Roseiflexaceae bacterium]